MFKTLIGGVSAILISTGVASAAQIDLASMNLAEATPSYAGSGDTVFDAPLESFATDFFFAPLTLNNFAGSELDLYYDFSGSFPSELTVDYGGGDVEEFDITDFGFTDNTLEFLLSQTSAALADPRIAVGQVGILRYTSDDFDFSVLDPLDFFNANLIDPDFNPIFLASGDLTLTALNAIPVPAGLPLLLSGIGGMYLMRRRKGRG